MLFRLSYFIDFIRTYMICLNSSGNPQFVYVDKHFSSIVRIMHGIQKLKIYLLCLSLLSLLYFRRLDLALRLPEPLVFQ